MFEVFIIFVFLLSFSIQIFFYLFFYLRFSFIKNNIEENKSIEPVSVIISAKNEYKNLKKFLPLILNQKYPEFQVIVLNDNSTDNSVEILKTLSEKHTHLKVVDIEKEAKGKKNALVKGISESKYDYLLFTDADCYPVSENWIAKMMSQFNKKVDIVLGYGAYEQKKGLLNKIIRFDTLFIALKYMSYSKAGLPYMGVGRNLAYKKTIFIENNGFESHKHIKSGDDDLFINENAKKTNVKVLVEYEGITKSIPEKTFKEFLKQKRRHLTTGFKYKKIHKFLLGTEVISLAIFYFGIVALIVFFKLYILVCSLYLVKLFLQIFAFSKFSSILKEDKNLIFIPIFDVLIPVLNLYAYLNPKITNNKKWK